MRRKSRPEGSAEMQTIDWFGELQKFAVSMSHGFSNSTAPPQLIRLSRQAKIN